MIPLHKIRKEIADIEGEGGVQLCSDNALSTNKHVCCGYWEGMFTTRSSHGFILRLFNVFVLWELILFVDLFLNCLDAPLVNICFRSRAAAMGGKYRKVSRSREKCCSAKKESSRHGTSNGRKSKITLENQERTSKTWCVFSVF